MLKNSLYFGKRAYSVLHDNRYMYLTKNYAINKDTIKSIGIGKYGIDIFNIPVTNPKLHQHHLVHGDNIAYVKWTHDGEKYVIWWPKDHEYYDHIEKFLDNGYYYKT